MAVQKLKEQFQNTAGVEVRDLSNPPARREIRADFPPIMHISHAEKITDVVKAGLEKMDRGFNTINRINIAYPHKHPLLFPDHKNRAEDAVAYFKASTEFHAPHIQWTPIDAIYDTRFLARSHSKTIVETLTERQIYGVDLCLQERPCALTTEGAGFENEPFILVDHMIDAGTTLAELYSYIEHNGGHVLAIVADIWKQCTKDYAQKRSAPSSVHISLSEHFRDATRNTGRLAEMALAFHGNALGMGKNWSANDCLEMFETALNKNGNSVFALTDGECLEVIKHIDYIDDFPALLDKLNAEAVQRITRSLTPQPA